MMEDGQNTTKNLDSKKPNDVLVSQPTQASQTPQNANQQIPQQETPANIPVVPKIPKKKKNPMMYILFFFLLILAVLFVANIFKKIKPTAKEEKTKVESTTTPEPEKTSSNGELAVVYENVNWKAPTRYVYQKEGGELVVGILEKNEEYSILEGKGSFGFTDAVSVSPNGKFLVYLRLPDEIINKYNEEPPYEFHGSNEWVVHLIDLTNLKNIKDSVIVSGVEFGMDLPNIYYWEPDGSKIYVLKSYDYSTNKQDVEVYNIKDNSLSKYNGEFSKFDALAFSPEGNYITRVEKGTGKNSIINTIYDLNLSKDNEQIKTLYKDYVSSSDENDVVMPNEKAVYLTREEFIHEGDSVCYIEKVDIENGEVTELQKKDCPPDQSYTSYHKPSLSPNGRYVVVTYAEGETGSIFVYDLIKKEGREIAHQNAWIDNYWWLSKNQIAVFIPKGRFGYQEDDIFVVNVETGETIKDPSLSGKSMEKIF